MSWYCDMNIWCRYYYKNFYLIEELKSYYQNGSKKYVHNFKNNQRNGEWIEWNPDGQFKSQCYYKNGELIYKGKIVHKLKTAQICISKFWKKRKKQRAVKKILYWYLHHYYRPNKAGYYKSKKEFIQSVQKLNP